MTDDDVGEMTRRIDSLVVGAGNLRELHRKLNTLTTNGSKNWQLLRSPMWVGDKLIAVVVKPDGDQSMKKTTVHCDRKGCGKSDARTISVWVDRKMDGAGSMEDEWSSVDLCADCMARELAKMMVRHPKLNELRGEVWIGSIKT